MTHQILVRPHAFVAGLDRIDLPLKEGWRTTSRMRTEQVLCPVAGIGAARGPAKMDTLMANLVPRLREDAMVTFGAGEHTNWAHRYFPTQRYASMISARNGFMGYSVPSAIAAALAYPERQIITIAGDAEFFMNWAGTRDRSAVWCHPLIVVTDNQ